MAAASLARGRTRPWFALAGAIVFVLLATANGAGYRYGASDQTFYIPAVLRALDPAAFPRDAALLDAEGQFMVIDEAFAAASRGTGLSLEVLFLAGYIGTLALTWTALGLISAHLYPSPWTPLALAAAFTLRHRIPETSANSFEPYFHPRMLAFSIGLLAVAAVQRRRPWAAVALVGCAAAAHITTGLWFAMLIGVAIVILDPWWRRAAIAGAAAAVVAGAWLFASGRLAPAFRPMDDVWLQAVASKDSLFATQWPAWAWAANLALIAVLWGAHVWRRRRNLADAEDAALVWGATAIVALFLLTLPLVAARAVLPVQLQISRVFWLVDVLALVYLVAAVAARPSTARVVAIVLIAVSVGRGMYVMLVEHPERALFAVHEVPSAWLDTMHWLRRHPLDVHILADPGHIWKEGTSVRVSAGRDVLLEEVKDAAIAIYSRDVAVRLVDRTQAIGDFSAMTAEHARVLARRYDLDYLVTRADLPLPLAYRNEKYSVYAIAEP